tara:strand:- start:3898 stop:4164 length:267 start_codon:yes stop_codon:yes gene_type:complete
MELTQTNEPAVKVSTDPIKEIISTEFAGRRKGSTKGDCWKECFNITNDKTLSEQDKVKKVKQVKDTHRRHKNIKGKKLRVINGKTVVS